MNKLLELGISYEHLKNMIDINSEILDLNDNEVDELVNILKVVNCSDFIIKNILVSNPYYLSRSINDVTKLINKLTDIGIKRLDITFDSNPWLLNKDVFEIEDFIKIKTSEGLKPDDIIDIIDFGMID